MTEPSVPRSLLFLFLLLSAGHAPAAAASDPARKLVLQAPPAAAVNSVTVSHDGAIVAAAAGEGGVRLYDASTGALTRVLGEVGDRNVVFSPDGRRIAAAGFHMDKLVGIYDVATGKRELALAGQQEWEADATAFSPDGRLLASTGTDRQVLIWNLATGTLLHQLKDQPARVAALAFSPDSKTLASGGGDRIVRLWDVSTGGVRRELTGHRDWICTLAFAPDGATVASGDCDWGFHRGHDWPRPASRGKEQSAWHLWEVSSGKHLRTESVIGRLLSLSYAPDGKSLACGIDNNVCLYSLSAGSPRQVLTTHYAGVTSVAFTPDGSALVSGSHDQTVKRTDRATGKTQWQAPGCFEQVNAVAMNSDASLLVTGSSDHRFTRLKVPASAKEIGPGATRLWDLRTGRMLRNLGDRTQQVLAVAISPDGQRIASGGALPTDRGVVQVWNAKTGDLIWSKTDYAQDVLAVAFAPSGAALGAGTSDGLIVTHDADTGKVLQSLPGHRGGATALAFSPDSKRLYGAEGHAGMRAWDSDSGQLVFTSRGADSRAEQFTIDRLLCSLGRDHAGTVLATCGSSVNNEFVDSVKLWDARTGQLKRDFAAENIHGRPMALSPDGSIIATGGKSVKLWDVRTGTKLRELFGHLKRTQSIVFSADGQLIVAGGSYGTTNIWDVTSGRHLITLFGFSNETQPPKPDDWLAYAADGFYDGSPGVEKYVAWRVGDELEMAASPGNRFRRSDLLNAALKAAKPTPQSAGRSQ